MKKLFFFLYILLLFASTAFSQSLEEQIRQYVLEKLSFYYVDNPASAPPTNRATLEINKIDIAANRDIASPLWTHANNAGLKTLLIKLLRSSANGGDVNLQRVAKNVLLISDKRVVVYLFNDISNVAFHPGWGACPGGTSYTTAHNNASWPCADYIPDRTSSASGQIYIGAYFFSPTRPDSSGGWSAEPEKGHVFIHELVHTQVPIVSEPTLTVNGYGTDKKHSLDEMIPSRNTAFGEGVATAFALQYFVPYGLSMDKWHNDNATLHVENLSGCASPPTPQCLQARLTNASVAADTTCHVNGASCYKIRNIPPPILLYNESVTANVLYQYMREFGSQLMLVQDIKNAATEMNNSSNYTFAPLFKEMTKSGMSFRNSKAAAGTHTHGQLMPIAILDFYTGYKLNNKAALEAALSISWDNTYTNIDDYFSSRRNTLLGFRTNATTWNIRQQLDKFAETINVKVSPAATSTSTAPRSGNN